MGMIDTIFSSPIPTAMAVFMAIVFGGVIWQFAIPQAAELKKIRLEVAEKDVELKELRATHTDDLKKMSQMLEDILTSVERPISIPALDELKSILATVAGQLNGNRNLDASTVRDLLNCMNAIDRNTERLLRTMSEVSEKQSQVSGIILGISMQRGEPTRGV